MSPADVAELVLLLTAAYPDYQLNDATAQTYQHFLADLDFEISKAVVVNHVATRKWFPKICELREAVLERELGIESVEVALMQIRDEDNLLSSLAVKALRLCGGTWEMNRTTNPSAWRAQFRKAYEGLREVAMEEKRNEATHGLLAQFKTTNNQLEEKNARSTRLTRGDSSGYFCHHCHKSHEASTRCPRQ
jgi:hypothetical protein